MNRLRQKGHDLEDIRNYTLLQFTMFLEAVVQNDAQDRLAFVTDLATVVGSLFSTEKPSPIAEHVQTLQDISSGVSHGEPEKRP